MKFNVAKCHSIASKQIKHEYALHNQTLEQVQCAKYLVITVSDNLGWSQLVSDISSEAPVTVIDIDHFYSLAVEAGFYGDTGRVIGFFSRS